MIGYVAKDRDGEVYFHTSEPTYKDDLKGWYSTLNVLNITREFSEFDNMSYKDEPIKVEITLKRL